MKALFLSRGRVFGIGMTAVVLLMSFIWLAHAAEWKPTKPITFVVPYAPGGGSDVLGRVHCQRHRQREALSSHDHG